MNLTENKRFPIRDVLVFYGSKHNTAVTPKPLTDSDSVKSMENDTISIEFPSNDSQNSNSNEIEIAEVYMKACKRPFGTLSNTNKSWNTTFNKTGKIVSKVS